MTDYLRLLWIGGGISREALECIEAALMLYTDDMEQGRLKTELLNVANGARAELQRMPEPEIDLING